MKKILLLISTLLVSAAGWAQYNDNTSGLSYTLNPYAYDLSSTWNPFEKKLTVRFRLNTPPNMSDNGKGNGYYNNSDAVEPRGIQIYAVDPDGNEYRIGGPGGGTIGAAFQATGDKYGYFQETLDLSGGVSINGCCPDIPIPKGVPLTWKVRVKDRHQNGDYIYQMLRNTGQSFDKLPYKVTGMATSNCPYAPNFGKTFVANTDDGSSLQNDATYKWLYDALKQNDWINDAKKWTPAVLEYSAQLKYSGRHRKNYHDGNTSYFSTTNFEPHRVRVSEDGRVFVSSYLTTAEWAVAEIIGGDSVVTIIKCDVEANKDENNEVPNTVARSKYNRRAIDFDVKGTGDDLKILVAWVTPKGTLKNQKYWYAKVECYEYQLGKAEKTGESLPFDQIVGTNKTNPNYITKVAEYNDFNSHDGHKHGLIFQGFAGSRQPQSDGEIYYNTYDSYTAGKYGFIGVAYGKGEGNPIWMKVDFGINKNKTEDNVYHEFNARILYFDNRSIEPRRDYKIPEAYSSSGYYGGHAIAVTDDYLIIADGRTQNYPSHNKHLLVYSLKDCSYIDNDKTEKTIKRLLSYPSGELPARMWATQITNETGANAAWISGLSVDYANNVYVTISTPQSKGYNSVTLNPINKVYILSLPATGYTDTPAPKGYEFMLPKDDAPVANIYPSKMRYVPAPVNDKYNFSFYANAKPKYAEIRFYRTQEDMKASMATVNDDNFQGDIESSKTDKLYCAYRIPNPKQGLNTVTLAMLGGEIGNDKYLTSAALPAGELYWSVYLETDRSSAFAPIYRQANSGVDAHHTLHATINNYPETDQFGTIYATSENGTDMKLMQYEIGDNGASTYNLNNTSRYSLTATYPYASLLNTHPRRMDIDADGLLYIAHEGYIEGYTDGMKYDNVPTFKEGGIYLWDPNTAVNGESIDLTLFSSNGIGTSSAVVLNNHPTDGWRVFAPNTYNEYKLHLKNETTGYTETEQNDKYGWNGFVEYKKNNYPNDWTWIDYTNREQNWTAKRWALKQGDASGNISLVAMDKGLWICQHREHSVAIKEAIGQSPADNPTAYVLRFVPYNSAQPEVRTWRSCWATSGSNNSQTGTAPIQATPGAGIAWRKINGEDYLYINNQDGNIVVEKLEWIKSTTYNQDEPRFYLDNEHLAVINTSDDIKGVMKVTLGDKSGNWKTAAVSSMCFDYAGNLVTTTGVCYESKDEYYVGSAYRTGDAFGTLKNAQNIIVYTMPYNRTNAREIQAPNSCVRIAERLAYTEDADAMATKVVENKATYIDLYRPMSNSSFSTICLPFDYDLSELVEGDPYYKAKVRAFEGVGLLTIGEEKILELQFGDPVTSIEANIPYIIQPEYNITGIVQIKQQVTLTNTSGGSTPITFNDGEKENSIAFQGVIPMTEIEKSDKTLILVADNRLATVSASGPMYGFRAYFQLASALPKGLKTKLGNKDNTVTGLIDVDGQKVNVNKFLQEGRVYIRVGDSLYTITGEKVE